MSDTELLELANEARERAYCAYSGIAVGAALLTDDGRVYTGVNIENSSYSPSVCAERVAFFTAVSHGVRNFRKIAIAGGKWGKKPDKPFYPCGVCRQVMGEFCDGDFEVIVAFSGGYKKHKFSELLPYAFTEEML